MGMLSLSGIMNPVMRHHLKRATHPHSPIRIFGFAVTTSIIICAAVGILNGLEALFAVLVLAVIEITFSFENAIVNAKVLEKMAKIWQIIFLTVGIAVAVFGMRVLLPLLIVSITADLSMAGVLDLALQHPDEYAHKLEEAHAVIAAFGGTFLLMIFLHFLFEDREVHWFDQLERPVRQLGLVWIGPLVIAATSLAVVTTVFAEDEMKDVFMAGMIGLVVYSAIKLLSDKFQQSGEKNLKKNQKRQAGGHLVRAGIFSFIYLELLDASFSFDGVVAAFAITKNVVLIAAGLGIGALFVRSLTVYLLRRGTLARYVFLEHGAFYAVGSLAMVMLVSIGHEIPSYITGSVGVSIIGLSLLSSKRHDGRQPHNG